MVLRGRQLAKQQRMLVRAMSEDEERRCYMCTGKETSEVYVSRRDKLHLSVSLYGFAKNKVQ
jgi:hypothetical protein